jgi:hypothetical protein
MTNLRRVSASFAAPVLVLALSWGLFDACLYTQTNLMGLYGVVAA